MKNILITIILSGIVMSCFSQDQSKLEKMVQNQFGKNVFKSLQYGKSFGDINKPNDVKANANSTEPCDCGTPDLVEGGLPVPNKGNEDDKGNFSDIQRDLKYSKSFNSATSDWILNTDPTVVPPSSNAQGFLTDAQEAASNYTGSLNYKIPLLNLSSYDIEIPIEVSYHTTGAKVDEIASWIGLGWTLNAGGAITRVMNGLPDEYVGTINTVYGVNLPAYGYLNLKNQSVDIATFPDAYSETMQKKFVRNSNWENLDGVDHGDGLGHGEAWDTRPDEFYFNFLDYSGKFVFNQNGEVISLPHNNLKITPTYKTFSIDGVNVKRIVKFEVITPEGYIFTFGDINMNCVETTTNISVSRKVRYWYPWAAFGQDPNGIDVDFWNRLPSLKVNSNCEIESTDLSCYNPFPYSSTWYLEKVISPTGDYIIFNYSENEFLEFTIAKRGQKVVLPNCSEAKLTKSGIDLLFLVSRLDDNLTRWHSQEVTFYRNEVLHNTKILNSIETKAGQRVEFVTSSVEREDLLGAKKLEFIRLYNENDIEKKSFRFVQRTTSPDQFQSKDHICLGTHPCNSNLCAEFYEYEGSANDVLLRSEQKRMLLEYIYQYDANGLNSLPPYQFIYNADILPRRAAYNTDLYGYNSDNDRGTNLRKIRYTSVMNDEMPVFGQYYDCFYVWNNMAYPGPSFEGQIVFHSESSAKASILEKVITPTLGSIEFIYESNRLSSGSQTQGLRVARINEYPDVTDISNYVQTNYSYSGGSKVVGNRSKVYYDRYEIPVNAKYGKTINALSSSVYGNLYTHGGVVGYESITIQKGANGYSKINYTNPSDYDDVPNISFEVPNNNLSLGNAFPFPPDMDMDWKRGFNTNTNHSLSTNNSTYSEEIVPNFSPSAFNKTTAYGLIGGVIWMDGLAEPNVFPHYYAGKHKFESNWPNFKSKTSTTYSTDLPGDNSEAIVNTEDYTYTVSNFENKQYTYRSETSTTTSSGKQLRNKTYYPLDIINAADVFMSEATINKMKEKNMLLVPLKEETYIDNELIQGTTQSYNIHPENAELIVPEIIRELMTNEYEIESEQIFDANSGRLIQTLKEDVFKSAIYWGYNNKYPIIKAENISYDELVSAVNSLQGNMELFLASIDNLEAENQRVNWNNFNTSLRNLIQEARITTYTYDPSNGITSETDAAGNTVFYSYDNFGRYVTKRDFDYQILEQIEYDYFSIIRVLPKIINLSSTSGSSQFNIESEVSWEASTEANWITLNTPITGNGNGSLSFSYTQNNSHSTRSTSIVLSSQSPPYNTTVIVSQVAEPFVEVNPISLEIPFGGGAAFSAEVLSNTIWHVTSSDDWITVEPQSGQLSNSINIQCESNDGNQRETQVIISGEGCGAILEIIQLANPH